MYPVGIRVVKVKGTDLGLIGTVIAIPANLARVHPDCDMAFTCDFTVIGALGMPIVAGSAIMTESCLWRPINPDADDENLVKGKELEELEEVL